MVMYGVCMCGVCDMYGRHKSVCTVYVCMVYVWFMSTCMVYIYGVCMVHVWCMCGTCIVYGVCMVYVCMYGVYIWCMYGSCLYMYGVHAHVSVHEMCVDGVYFRWWIVDGVCVYMMDTWWMDCVCVRVSVYMV